MALIHVYIFFMHLKCLIGFSKSAFSDELEDEFIWKMNSVQTHSPNSLERLGGVRAGADDLEAPKIQNSSRNSSPRRVLMALDEAH